MNSCRTLLALVNRPLTLIASLLALLGSMVFVVPARAATFTVNSTADTVDATPGNAICADASNNCTLRAAIMEANALPGADSINLPAGTYLLTLANAGGTNEDQDATGDLDVLDSLTINGAGSATTIIEAGTNTSNGIDKVLALNPICASAINVAIDGVTVRFGRNTQPAGASDFSFTGGGIDWCSAASGGTLTLTNSVVSDNTNVNGYGGGLNVDTVSSPTTVNITNVTFSNNQTLSTTNTATGGAINLFGDQPTITITNSTFTGNHMANPTSGGGAIYFRPTTVGHLSVSGSTFTNNTAPGIGGAIATDSHGAGTTIDIQDSVFSGNTATNSFGGALNLDGTNLNTTPFSLSHLIITGNTAGISGGGIYVGHSNVSMSKSLIVGNSAPSGSGIHKSVDVATANVAENWWGCSTGPGAAACDTATTSGGTLSFTPWYRDQLTAATSPLAVNQSTSLTASFLTDSAGNPVPVADLAEIIGRTVTWAATNGALSNTQGTVQATGTASGTFQATAAGTAVISAKVDNDNTSPVSSNVLSLTVNKADTTVAITNAASLSSTDSVTGQPVTVTFHVTSSTGSTPTAPTGNVSVSDGTISCASSIDSNGDGSCSLTFTSAGTKSLTATYAGDANFNASPASAAVSHTVNKADITTTITSDAPDPSVVGQSVTVQFNVTVNAPGAGTPTGTVMVSDGTESCTATVAAGACNLTFTTAGAKTLTATYAGDANFNASPASAAESHTVNKADTTTTITSDNPDPSNAGQPVTVQYNVTVNAPGVGIPTGNVTVSDGVDSCTGTVAAGQCSITLNTAGARTLTATYAGDSNFNGSTSAGVAHQVNVPDTTPPDTSINSNPSNPTNSTSATFTFSGTDTGSGVASFECALDSSGFAACTSPQSYSGLSDGSHTFQVRAIDVAGNIDQTPASFTWLIDTLPPSVTVNQAAGQADPTSNSPINFTAVFSEPVTGFATGEVTVSGTAGATTAVVTGGPTTYNIAVSGMNAAGTVIASIPANVATDAAGNANTASTSTDNTVTFVVVPPPISDDFNTCSLNPFWTLVDPRGGGTVQLTGMGTNDALLHINVPAGVSHDIWSDGNNAVRVMQAATNGDFEVQAKFQSTFTAGYQIEGLLVEQDAGRWLRFDANFDGSRRFLYAATLANGTATTRANLTLSSASPIWLGIKRVGNSWTLRYSLNGTSWTNAVSFSDTFVVNRVGLTAGNYSISPTGAPAFTALVDYFLNVAAPFVPAEDGPPQLPAATLTTNVVGSGTVNVSPQKTAYYCSEVVTLTAVPSSGFAFQAWSGDLSGATPQQTLTMNQSHTVTATFVSSGIPPVLSQIRAAPRPTCALIQWTTDVPATSRVSFGQTVGYELGSVFDAAMVTSHAITLTSLSPGTPYHYQVASTDAGNNLAQSLDQTFSTPAVPTGLFSDDFNTCALNPGWTLVDPRGGGTAQVTGMGTNDALLHIGVPAGASHDIWSDGDNAVRVMQAAANSDFEVQAKFQSTFTARYQIEGLLVEQDAGRWLRFDANFDGSHFFLYAGTLANGTVTTRANLTVSSASPIWLGIKRVGNSWTLRYSLNGTTWTNAASFSDTFVVNRVGLTAGNYSTSPTGAPAFTALVDYFLNVADPFLVEDGPL